jgi:exodeoxyribonuclease VII large subunit
MSDTPSNLPEIGVSELSGAIRRTVEDAFGYVRVRGEVSGYKGPVASGHVYFSLKDQNAKIDAVIWKGTFARLRFRPEEGMEVVATGKVTTFPGKSSYQIVIEALEPAGIGALLAQLEERRKRLAAEGLFDPARKRSPPYIPVVIGVVTSPTGAVIRDILHRLADRFPRDVLLWPVRVQGETSAREVAEAIRGLNAIAPGGPVPRPDVLIVARGGGSLEDLWSFNEEIVVRAVAESAIPLISAVGHETDWTLIDHVADVRAPTPTGAAEMVVPVRSELLANLADLDGRLQAALRRLVERRRTEFRGAARALPTGEQLVTGPRQRIDLATAKLAPAVAGALAQRQRALAAVGQRLERRSPASELARRSERLAGLSQRLGNGLSGLLLRAAQDNIRQRVALGQLGGRLSAAGGDFVSRQAERVRRLAQLLDSLGHKAVLARGYAIVMDASGRPVQRAGEIAPGQPLALAMIDGQVGVTADGGVRPAGARPRPARREPGGQSDLFG